MVVIAITITAALVAREVQRNRRARARLVGDGYEVQFTPPWLGHSEGGASHTAEGDRRTPGVWSCWYRDGRLGAYVCTQVRVRMSSPRREVGISSARLEIVDDPDGRQSVLAAEDLPITPAHGAEGRLHSTLDIDASINASSDAPGRGAVLMLRLNLDGARVERRLCAVEHRFAASGAVPLDS
jgi:hypothetical protein